MQHSLQALELIRWESQLTYHGVHLDTQEREARGLPVKFVLGYWYPEGGTYQKARYGSTFSHKNLLKIQGGVVIGP